MDNVEHLLSWVHLSDIHFEAKKGSIIADQALILDEITKDINNHEKRGVPRPDLIILTGDIAQSGDARPTMGSVGEYALASNIISTLKQTLNIEDANCLVIPGNHDIDRNITNRNQIRMLTQLREGNELIDDVLVDENDRELLMQRIINYIEFAKNNAPSCIDDNNNTWWSHLYYKSGSKIRFIGLNTSLLSDTDDMGRLQLGNYQFKNLLIDNKSSEDEIIVALTHHPVEWLKDCNEVRPLIQKKCDIHVYGHVHNSNFQSIIKSSGQTLTQISAGAAYCNDKGYYSYSYNICSIVKASNGNINIRCWPRLWSIKNKEFRDDTDNLDDQKKYAEHTIRDGKNNISLSTTNDKIQTDFSPKESTSVSIRITKDYLDCDPPPSSYTWVGRETELGIIKDPTIKVFAVTGIGGQGKSALASKVIKEIDGIAYWDWRDCREVGDTFQTQLFRIIERITGGRITARAFIGQELTTAIYYFFDIIKNIDGYFVLDNIDHYIDVEAKKPIGVMKLFIDAALSRQHKSRIILTCRPSIQYDSQAYFEISLPGLSIEETQKLFTQRGITIDDQVRKEIYNVQNITQGHPLWLNLIATQVAKNKSSLTTLIHEIKKGKESGLPFPTLDSIWKTLNEKQKTILKCMAETLRPESEERLESYLCDQLNYNQLSKGIRSLKLLNLIVEKKSNAQNELLELHPLIKTYIISHFPKKERSKYISLITVFIDKTIQKCRKEISKRASFAMLEYWVMRTELAVNAGYLEDALINISEVGDALCSSGHSIEFIRVCCDLFDEIQFVDAVMNEYKEFDEVFHLFVDNLALNGRFDDADVYLERYKSAISGKSARYINYCNLLCYVNWCKKDFSLAVYWGQIGSELKQKHNLDTRFDCEHNLALSRRDNGEIDLALIYFMSGSTFEDVVNPDIISKEKGGHYYGNIGRCLWFNKDIQNAITCYKKALKLLDDYDDESYDNRGWGCYWSAEALEMEEKVLIAYCLYLKAKKLWEKVSPPKAVMAEDRANILYASNIKHINRPNIDDIQIERNYQAWLISSG